VTEIDLVNARSHVQQFQEISQANEFALATLSATHDEYKTSTEAQIARHEVCTLVLRYSPLIQPFGLQSDYKALEQQLQSVQEEMAQLKTQHNELQRNLESERTTWLNDKKVLEDTIVDMSTLEKHQETDRTLREGTAREQEERAKVSVPFHLHLIFLRNLCRLPKRGTLTRLLSMLNQSKLSIILKNNCRRPKRLCEIIKLLQKLQRRTLRCRRTAGSNRRKLS